jgi:hypothetical protein
MSILQSDKMEFTFLFPENIAPHFSCCLMQGLHQLGHKINCNINPVGKGSSHGLAPPFSQTGADFINVTSNWTGGKLVVDVSNGIGSSPNAILEFAKTSKVVLINMNDSANWSDYTDNFVAFSAHCNKYAKRRGRILPIGFGLSQDVINLSNSLIDAKKSDSVLKNFRPSENQSVRNVLDLIFVPKLRGILPVNERFSSPEQYAKDLASHQAVLAYGGDLYSDLRINPFFKERDVHNRLNFIGLPPHPVVLRFDSWRFYESALFAACPITLDFDMYGLMLPNNPSAYVHYLPVDLCNIDAFISELKKSIAGDPDYLINIGRNARNWVLDNYSPTAMAKEFIDGMIRLNFI